jgi:predicted DCC family thiol-disulfide oxidoreductase YuxK
VQNHPIVFFDGVCGLCNGIVTFVLGQDKRQVLRFAPLQGKTGVDLLDESVRASMDTLVLWDNGKAFFKSDAVIEIFSRLGGPWRMMRCLSVLPRVLRDFLYDRVAANRYAMFGKQSQCRIPTPEEASLFLK